MLILLVDFGLYMLVFFVVYIYIYIYSFFSDLAACRNKDYYRSSLSAQTGIAELTIAITKSHAEIT